MQSKRKLEESTKIQQQYQKKLSTVRSQNDHVDKLTGHNAAVKVFLFK